LEKGKTQRTSKIYQRWNVFVIFPANAGAKDRLLAIWCFFPWGRGRKVRGRGRGRGKGGCTLTEIGT